MSLRQRRQQSRQHSRQRRRLPHRNLPPRRPPSLRLQPNRRLPPNRLPLPNLPKRYPCSKSWRTSRTMTTRTNCPRTSLSRKRPAKLPRPATNSSPSKTSLLKTRKSLASCSPSLKRPRWNSRQRPSNRTTIPTRTPTTNGHAATTITTSNVSTTTITTTSNAPTIRTTTTTITGATTSSPNVATRTTAACRNMTSRTSSQASVCWKSCKTATASSVRRTTTTCLHPTTSTYPNRKSSCSD